MTRVFEICNTRVEVKRTAERATVLSVNGREIVTRNVWVGDDGRKYVQYKGEFRSVSKSSYYTHDYRMW